MTLSAAQQHRVLADVVVPSRSRALAWATDAALVVAGTALVAVAAQIAIPFWPVPLTAQTFAVLLVGVALGPLRGTAALGLYLVIGVLGIPAFAEGKSGSLFALTTGGYIIGFIAAAALVGWLARRAWDRKVLGMFVTYVSGSAVIYAFGLPWLYVSLSNLGPAVWQDALGYDTLIGATLGAGMFPFLLGDLLKAVLAAALVPLVWKGVHALDARKK
ncbi:biotin transporter BioY [Microbacterium sp.]|uniref:biotin transporter BioY n=1 Tax=Microbacterium sp. TaxID=51671 RepID=UPI002E2FDD0D|nr:biotin transporter BioY [Microbacterium sp.]HEX5730515.1 biotin transporter BioY [Microbacterium sp.]